MYIYIGKGTHILLILGGEHPDSASPLQDLSSKNRKPSTPVMFSDQSLNINMIMIALIEVAGLHIGNTNNPSLMTVLQDSI